MPDLDHQHLTLESNDQDFGHSTNTRAHWHGAVAAARPLFLEDPVETAGQLVVRLPAETPHHQTSLADLDEPDRLLGVEDVETARMPTPRMVRT